MGKTSPATQIALESDRVELSPPKRRDQDRRRGGPVRAQFEARTPERQRVPLCACIGAHLPCASFQPSASRRSTFVRRTLARIGRPVRASVNSSVRV